MKYSKWKVRNKKSEVGGILPDFDKDACRIMNERQGQAQCSSLFQSLIWIIILPLCFSFQSCSTTKYLKQGEYLLDKNKIVIKENIDNKSDVSYELSTFYRQTPNTNYGIFFPRERSYFVDNLNNKDSKWRKWRRKSIGEQPSIYSDSLTTITALDMQKHLRYNGYLNAKVIPQRDPRNKKMRVTYYALPGIRYMIDSISFYSQDPDVASILNDHERESHFKTKTPLDLSLFNQEKLRIISLLKNNGYAQFSPTYVDDLEIDTFQVSNQANLYINVLPPYGDSVHQVYYIGDINVFFDNNTARKAGVVQDTTIGGVNFFLSERGFVVSSYTLRKAISLRLGERFSQDAYDRTLDQLSELGMFRFVRIKQVPDPVQKDLIHFNIQLTTNFKMEFSANLDLNYTNSESNPNSSNLIGVSLSPSLVNRNFFGGAELFSASLHAGLEVAPSNIGNNNFWNTIDLGADFSLSLPKFVDYLGIWRKLYRIKTGKDEHFLNKRFYTGLQQKANTRANASYNYLEIFDWYKYNLVAVSYGFDFKPDRNTNYSINHFVINFLDPITELRFDTVLMNNGFLQRSFGQQVFVSLLFRDLNFVKRSSTSRRGRSLYFSGNIETAGSEIFAINKLYNWIANDTVVFPGNRSVKISQYLRTEIDFRYLKQVSMNQAFAARLNVGVARPFGNTTDVPYVKQFFVGGSNSMRAWAPRGLGPGSYLDPDSSLLLSENSYRLFQTGDLKMELNAEYRFPLFSFINMAFFVDVGNVWTFEEDEDRPGSQFLFRKKTRKYNEEDFVHYPFYKQLAVSPGAGIRVDLSYFVFRFDVGVKLRTPYPQNREELSQDPIWWNKVNQLESTDFGYNFGLGFPF